MAVDPVLLGRIVGLFGVRGWVKVFSYTDPREAILQYSEWILRQNGERSTVKIAEGKRHGKSVIARIDGVDDREQAGALVGAEIGVARDAMPAPEAGRYYWRDLEGLLVVRADGTELGRIEYLLETGANDVMVVQGDQERLIPFVMQDVVLEVDLQEGKVSVDWEWD